MPIYIERAPTDELIRKCRALRDAADPRSQALKRAREDFRLIVAEDHYHMMLEGVDRDGRARAPLAASTLADPKRGPGPSLIPNFFRSRFIANAEVLWRSEGVVSVLVKRFRDILSKPTKKSPPRPFAQYHLDGATKPGTNWVLPARDVGSLSKKGHGELRLRFNKLVKDLATYWKGRS